MDSSILINGKLFDYYKSQKSRQSHKTYFQNFPKEITEAILKNGCLNFYIDGITPAIEIYNELKTLPDFKKWNVFAAEIHLKEIRQSGSRFFGLIDKLIEMENEIVSFMRQNHSVQVFQLHSGNLEFKSNDDSINMIMRNCSLTEGSIFIGVK